MDTKDLDFQKIRLENSERRKKITSQTDLQEIIHPKTGNLILSAQNISKSYKIGKIRLEVLKDASLDIYTGQFLAIIGASGSGKSTLLHILGGLDKPDMGSVYYNQENISHFSQRQINTYRNKEIGFVFQFYHLLDELTVLENVLLPAMASKSTFGWFRSSSKLKKQAKNLLSLVSLADRANQKAYQLSGGERQRVAIARAMMNEPKIILADEPTGNLDSATGLGIMSVLENLNRTGQTIVMVTHDNSIASRADRVIRILDGTIAAN